MMLSIIDTLNEIRSEDTRLDDQIELDEIPANDDFSRKMVATIRSMLNVNYKWHIYFLLLYKLEQRPAEMSISEFVTVFESSLLLQPALGMLSGFADYEDIVLCLMNCIADVIADEQRIEFLWMSANEHYTHAFEKICPVIAEKKLSRRRAVEGVFAAI